MKRGRGRPSALRFALISAGLGGRQHAKGTLRRGWKRWPLEAGGEPPFVLGAGNQTAVITGVGQHPGCHPAPGFWRAPVAKPGGAGTRPRCALSPSRPLAPEISPSPSRRCFRVCFGWFHAFLLAADKISGESQTGAVDAGR